MPPLVQLNEVEVFAEGLDHAEGICLAPDGYFYLGGELGQLYRAANDGTLTEIIRTEGFSLGVAADADSNVYLCDQGKRCVWKVVPDTGHYEVFARGTAGRPMRSPNWGCFDGEGNYYVSDSGGWGSADGMIWKVDRSGRAAVWTEACRDFPNGMCVSPDSRTLFVLESTPPALVAVGILPNGSAGARRIVAELPDTVPDGVALLADGRMVVSCYRPDAVYLIERDGGREVIVEDPQGTVIAAPTNIVFAGEKLEQMVVPNFNRWHLARFEVPGLVGAPLHYPSVSFTPPIHQPK